MKTTLAAVALLVVLAVPALAGNIPFDVAPPPPPPPETATTTTQTPALIQTLQLLISLGGLLP